VIGNSHLSPDNDVVFYDGAAGKAALSGDDYIFADLNVMANVHQVVDFCAATDASFVEGTAIRRAR